MHRKTTSRRENKRLDNKSRRQAVAQALRGDHLRVPKSGWTFRFQQDTVPLDMEPRPSHHKKHKREIEYCPARQAEGKKRHYYIDKSVEKSYWSGWPNELSERKYTHRYKECMYCGKTRRPSRKGGRHYY